MKNPTILLILIFFALNVKAQSVVISESSLTTTEGLSPVTYFISLSQAPSNGEAVTITPSSQDVTEGTVSGSVSFTSSDWDQQKSVTITPGTSGDGNDGDVSYMITHNVMTSGGAGTYSGVLAPSISVININVDGVSIITVDPSSAVIVDEEGTQVPVITFGVTNIGGNMDDIIFTLTNNNPADITLSGTSITLNSANSYTTSITITGISDMVVEGTVPFSITTENAISNNPIIDGFDPVDINGSVIEVPPAPIPTLGEWGLLILFLFTSIGAVVFLSSPKQIVKPI